MASLYELTGEYLQLLNMMEDGDVDEETIADTLEGVTGEIEDKADGYAKVIRSIEGDVAGIKAEIDRLTTRKNTLENNAKRLKENLEQSMIATGKTKFQTQLFGFGVQKNPPAVVIDNEAEIPEQFFIPQAPKLDKAEIKKYLKDNDAEWAHLAQTESLRIR